MSNDEFQIWVEQVNTRLNKLEVKLEKLLKRENILDGEILLDNQDLCFLLKVSKRSLQRYRSEKLLKYHISRQKTYYYESDVQKFIKENLSEISKDRLKK